MTRRAWLLLFALACADEEPVNDTGPAPTCSAFHEDGCLVWWCCFDGQCWLTDDVTVWPCESGSCEVAWSQAERECR